MGSASTGKAALVTGAGRGLGQAFALALAEAGADVAAVDIRGDWAAATAEAVASRGRKSLGIAADLSRPPEAARMVEQVVSAWGRLDIAVNNAGLSLPIGPALEISEEDWDRLFEREPEGHLLLLPGRGPGDDSLQLRADRQRGLDLRPHRLARAAGAVQRLQGRRRST